MIELFINNKKVKAKKGETVLEVCQREGIKIPTLCYHKELSPYGGCRMCIVEVEGMARPVTSCTLPVQEGMRVITDSPKLKALRKFNLQLILSEHPSACRECEHKAECDDFQKCIRKTNISFGCRFCPKDHNCELQKLVKEFQIKDIPYEYHYRGLDIERFDPFFDRDYNLCILCARCVRVCQEIREAGILDFHHRGPETMVGTAFALPHLDAGCQFCGACVDVCPTGALQDRFAKYQPKPERSVKTTCTLCALGCDIELNVAQDKVVSSRPTSSDNICVRGRFGIARIVHHPRRITSPLLKKGNLIIEAEWHEAIEKTLKTLEEHKNNLGIVYSPQLSLEAIEGLYKLSQALNGSITTPLQIYPGLKPVQFKGLKNRPLFVVINTDLTTDFSVFLLKMKRSLKEPLEIIVIDPFKNYCGINATLWLRPAPDRLNNLLKILFSKTRFRNTTGIDDVEIERARGLIRNRDVYLVYNQLNLYDVNLPERVKKVPLYSQINTLRVNKYGIDTSYYDLLASHKIDCLYTIGVTPELSNRYKAVIVQNCFRPGSDFDIFLPATTFAETKGSYLNLEARLKKTRPAVSPAGKARADQEIIQELIKGLGIKGNTRIVYKKGKPESRLPKRTSKKYPYFLYVRENAYQFRSQPLSSILSGFEILRQDRYLQINPSDARRLNLKDGDTVRIQGERIDLEVPVKVVPDIFKGSLLIYTNPSWGEIQSQPVRLKCIRS